ncbi:MULTISPECIES: hypothetical protein [Bacillaceae]|uniref:Uncharacterized protein n=1 Tax=Evansella alkalicola TaxID=745819 RepID=A0ABS6JNZ3_9BACI|nr:MULTISPECIES: hypothetical protein [Bacillaceae]MBU9720281.1 hypothetical protein [Bacillus alkalicola]
MVINFTKKQYKHLLDLVFLGEWTANAIATGINVNKEYKAMLEYISLRAEEFGHGELFDNEFHPGEASPTFEYEQEMFAIIDRYENEVFWDELADRLAKRDLINHDEYDNHEEYLREMSDISAKYYEEFDKNGINNLILKKGYYLKLIK